MRHGLPGIGSKVVRVNRDFWRVRAPLMSSISGRRLAALVLGGVALAACASLSLAQSSDQQIRCLQLQQELVSASQGGGANSDDIARIDKQIAQYDRVFQGTQAAMQDAGCFESFFIFGKALVRSPQCLNMNDRVEDARRQLTQLQQQRAALTGGGGNKRRQAELQQAMAQSGCGGQVRQPPRRGGLFDFFGGGQEEEPAQPETPIYRSIDPNGRYRSVCVRLCDGFFYPISFSTYASNLAQEAERCQSSCAAPAELYVYRNPGQEIEQAISLNGSAYVDLPVALKFRKAYVNGCSCKQAEYNPTEIEEANKRAEAEAASQPAKGKGKGKVAAIPPAVPAPQAAATPPAGAGEVTGSNAPANPQAQPAVPQAQKPPALPAPAAAAAPPQPAQAQASSAGSGGQGAAASSVIKKSSKPAAPPPPQ